MPDPNNQFFGPQLNLISMKMPPKPFLIDKDNADDSKFCNATSLLDKKINCKKEFCECSHVLQVPLNASVELIIVDEGYKYDANHPFHLHGHGFRVVGMERIKPEGISIEEVWCLLKLILISNIKVLRCRFKLWKKPVNCHDDYRRRHLKIP